MKIKNTTASPFCRTLFLSLSLLCVRMPAFAEDKTPDCKPDANPVNALGKLFNGCSITEEGNLEYDEGKKKENLKKASNRIFEIFTAPELNDCALCAEIKKLYVKDARGAKVLDEDRVKNGINDWINSFPQVAGPIIYVVGPPGGDLSSTGKRVLLKLGVDEKVILGYSNLKRPVFLADLKKRLASYKTEEFMALKDPGPLGRWLNIFYHTADEIITPPKVEPVKPLEEKKVASIAVGKVKTDGERKGSGKALSPKSEKGGKNSGGRGNGAKGRKGQGVPPVLNQGGGIGSSGGVSQSAPPQYQGDLSKLSIHPQQIGDKIAADALFGRVSSNWDGSRLAAYGKPSVSGDPDVVYLGHPLSIRLTSERNAASDNGDVDSSVISIVDTQNKSFKNIYKSDLPPGGEVNFAFPSGEPGKVFQYTVKRDVQGRITLTSDSGDASKSAVNDRGTTFSTTYEQLGQWRQERALAMGGKFHATVNGKEEWYYLVPQSAKAAGWQFLKINPDGTAGDVVGMADMLKTGDHGQAESLKGKDGGVPLGSLGAGKFQYLRQGDKGWEAYEKAFEPKKDDKEVKKAAEQTASGGNQDRNAPGQGESGEKEGGNKQTSGGGQSGDEEESKEGFASFAGTYLPAIHDGNVKIHWNFSVLKGTDLGVGDDTHVIKVTADGGAHQLYVYFPGDKVIQFNGILVCEYAGKGCIEKKEGEYLIRVAGLEKTSDDADWLELNGRDELKLVAKPSGKKVPVTNPRLYHIAVKDLDKLTSYSWQKVTARPPRWNLTDAEVAAVSFEDLDLATKDSDRVLMYNFSLKDDDVAGRIGKFVDSVKKQPVEENAFFNGVPENKAAFDSNKRVLAEYAAQQRETDKKKHSSDLEKWGPYISIKLTGEAGNIAVSFNSHEEKDKKKKDSLGSEGTCELAVVECGEGKMMLDWSSGCKKESVCKGK